MGYLPDTFASNIYLETEESPYEELSISRRDWLRLPILATTLSRIDMFGAGTNNLQGVLAFSTNNTGNRESGPVERMRIHTNGYVGIGTTNPEAKLSINGGLHVGGESDPGDDNLLVDGKVTANQGFFGNSAGTINPILEAIGYTDTEIETTYVRSPSNAGKICFQSNCKNTALAIDTSSGNVGIGTGNLSARLCVKTTPFEVKGVSISKNSPIVTGSGTSFYTQIAVGDQITLQGEMKNVKEIESDTSLKADSNFSSFTPPGYTETMTVLSDIFRADDSSGNTRFIISRDGNVGIKGGIKLSFGEMINEFSVDGTFADNSDSAVPTEKAVKTYVTKVIREDGLTTSIRAPPNGRWINFQSYLAKTALVIDTLSGNVYINNGKLEVNGIVKAKEFIGKGTVQIQRGEFDISNLGDREGNGSVHHSTDKVFYFNPPFSESPKVILGVNYLDAIQGSNLRYNVYVQELSAEKVWIIFDTWSDTEIYQARVQWMAFGPN